MKPELRQSSLADTPKRPAAEALRESEERNRRIVETANEGIWTLDADCRTTFANPRLAAMLGCTVEELLGHETEDFLFPEDVPAHRERIARRRNGESSTYDLRLRRKDDSECWTLTSASPVLDAQGRYAGSFAMLSDITDRKRAQEALRQQSETVRARNTELEILNHAMVDRGLRMIDLKEEINELHRRLGEPPRQATDPLQNDSVPGAGPAPSPPGGGGA